jgi:hypothetical protein
MRSLLDVHILMSDADTWRGTDRPLRQDQLRSVGLAAHEFATPASAPPIVHLARVQVGGALLDRVHREQDETAPEHRTDGIPGVNFFRGLAAAIRTKHSPREVVRLFSRSVLPPWLTANEQATQALAGIARVTCRRLAGLVRRSGLRRGQQQSGGPSAGNV